MQHGSVGPGGVAPPHVCELTTVDVKLDPVKYCIQIFFLQKVNQGVRLERNVCMVRVVRDK